ncbi:MAG: PIN domain-containing protein [Methylococcaceae bacterium]|nr:PIN domain-containing protein [Methylococcaceae bacterium]MDP3903953.1 PIN domain-containing protein [Methylococcaceae bacterium]
MTVIEQSQQANSGSAKSTTKVLFIDLENCPSQVNELINHLEQYSQVVICYAASGAKVPVDWIVSLTATVNDNRLKILKMPNGGKNAADFGIAFWAGFLMAQLPEYAHFDIVSNDADLDHVVNLLKSQQRSAKRIGTNKNTQPVVLEPGPLQSKQSYLQEYCIHLVNHHKNRPVKKETLINSIKSKFKADSLNVDDLFEALVKQSIISVTDNKITYNQQKITKFAGL